jgi:hypothetical protein
MSFRTHQLYTAKITGGAVTTFAAAKTGYRVKLFAYAVTAGGVFEDTDGTDLTGVMPASALNAAQPDFLLVSPNDKGMAFNGAGTGFAVFAYEKYQIPSN